MLEWIAPIGSLLAAAVTLVILWRDLRNKTHSVREDTLENIIENIKSQLAEAKKLCEEQEQEIHRLERRNDDLLTRWLERKPRKD